jgi:predicted ribosomally synthesized peptide with nif11-like leader
MSIIAAQNFRQHVNRMSTLQAEVAPYVSNGVIDYAGIAELGSRSGFDFTAEEAKQVLSRDDDELSDFEMEMVSGGTMTPPSLKSHGGQGKLGR